MFLDHTAQMWPTATRVTCSMIYLSVCVLGTLASPATTDEPIEMLFGKGKAHTGQCITLVTPGNMII